MANTTQHAPTPWRVSGDFIEDANGKAIKQEAAFVEGSQMGKPEALANLAIIMKSVNAHDALVEIVRAVLAAEPHAGRWSDECRAALALAKEPQTP